MAAEGRSGLDPIIISCKGVAFEILSGSELRRLTIDFYTFKMGVDEHPRKFPLPVDRMIKDLERIARPVHLKDVNIVILGGPASKNADSRMPTRSSDGHARERNECTVINPYERSVSNNSEPRANRWGRQVGRAAIRILK